MTIAHELTKLVDDLQPIITTLYDAGEGWGAESLEEAMGVLRAIVAKCEGKVLVKVRYRDGCGDPRQAYTPYVVGVGNDDAEALETIQAVIEKGGW